jgi:MATE family multidrug resistance protein
MLWNLAAHWAVGLPIAYILAFRFDFGVTGLWWGLSAGLIICGVALLAVWWMRVRTVLSPPMKPAGGTMPEQKDAPRPHGDPFELEVD